MSKVRNMHVAPRLQKFLSNSDWMESIEQIKKIGINNVEKGSRLYHFLLKQRRDYKVAKVAE